jgi:hypothetical protein
MNKVIPCASLLIILFLSHLGWAQYSGSCDYILQVLDCVYMEPGTSVSWPIAFGHHWGDPAIGTWGLTKSGCPSLTFSPASGTFSVSSGGTTIVPVTVSVASDTCARNDAVLTVDSIACGKSKTESGNICVVPTSETTLCVREWDYFQGDPLGDGAQFSVKLDPLSADFLGRVVTEVFVNITDGCQCGTLPAFGAGNASSWTIIAGNEYNNFDSVGYQTTSARAIIVHYGVNPCLNECTQQMWINCDSGMSYMYEAHQLSWWTDQDGYYFVERDGASGGPYGTP